MIIGELVVLNYQHFSRLLGSYCDFTKKTFIPWRIKEKFVWINPHRLNSLSYFSLICSRLEGNVWRVVSPYFNSVKDISVKHNLIRTVELIGKAVQPNHIQSDEFVFQKRGDLLRHMQVSYGNSF